MRPKKEQKTWWDQLKEADPYFISEIESMGVDSLRDSLVKLCVRKQELEEAKKMDPDLSRIKEELKTANETYSGPLKTIKLKTKALLEMIERRSDS